MSFELRKDIRFDDFGKVEAPDLCLLPGILIDISLSGCKVRFPLRTSVDMDADYELKIAPTRKKNIQPFVLFARPMWTQTEDTHTEIGFRVLHSPGTRQLASYMRQLSESEEAGDIPAKKQYQYV